MAKADKALVARRVDEILRIRLDGAEFWDVRDFIRQNESAPDSAWLLADGDKPMSDRQIARYLSKADAIMQTAGERNHRKLFREHRAKRRNLYARAVTTGDLRTALACIRDEAEMLALYPTAKVQPVTLAAPVVYIEVSVSSHVEIQVHTEEASTAEGGHFTPAHASTNGTNGLSTPG